MIKLITKYLDYLYDREIENFPSIVFDGEGKIVLQNYDKLNSSDIFNLIKANRELSECLFDYVCSILESNRNIMLDIETLRGLLNRNPKLFTLSGEKSYLYRPFDYKKLVKIINNNHVMEGLNINVDDIYQLLLDTCQFNNDYVFKNLIKPEQFTENHQRVNEILTWCNAESFVEITNIIRRNFDKNFDRFSIAKKRSKDKFCERLIIALLHWPIDKDDYDLIHQILTEPEIEIDYELYFADYLGQTNLKSIIALSGNRTIIKDLLSKEQNIQNYYSYGDQYVQLYVLYALTGDYEKALDNFSKNYNFKYDFDDEDNNWDKFGYAYGGWSYMDSFARFIRSMCSSFKEDNIDYSTIISLISRVINNENVKYINLEETLAPIQEVLLYDDFKLLIDVLLEKYNSGNLGFLNVNYHDGMFTRYIVRIAKEDEVQNYLNTLSKEVKKKSLICNKKDDRNNYRFGNISYSL